MDSLMQHLITSEINNPFAQLNESGHLFNLADFGVDSYGSNLLLSEAQAAVANLPRKTRPAAIISTGEAIKQHRYGVSASTSASSVSDNISIEAAIGQPSTDCLEKTDSNMPADQLPKHTSVETESPGQMSTANGKRKQQDDEDVDERQARIRLRNREQARRCRQKKKQKSEDLSRKVNILSHENEVLRKAFSVLYSQKAQLESVIVGQFGHLGQMIIQSTSSMEATDPQQTSQLNGTVTALSSALGNPNLSNLHMQGQMPQPDVASLSSVNPGLLAAFMAASAGSEQLSANLPAANLNALMASRAPFTQSLQSN